MTIAHKTFSPVEVKLSETGDIELAFAQLNVIDLDGDVTLPGACAAKEVPMSAYGHGSWDGALPTGKGTISERGDWAVFKGAFFMDTIAGRDTYATVKALGSLAEYSYGYLPTEYSFGQQDGADVRFLQAVDVFEVSPVLRGAGIGTHTLAIKSGAPGPEASYAEHASWLREAVSTFSDRANAKAEWRAQEGRGLSVANRADLAELVKALREFPAVADELEALLKATDPGKADRIRRTEIAILVGRARAHGVIV